MGLTCRDSHIRSNKHGLTPENYPYDQHLVSDLAAQTSANFASSLAQFCFALGNFLHHNCVTMVQTRFVVFIENFMIRRQSVTIFCLMMNTVSSRFRAVPAWSSGTLCELTRTSQFGSSEKCVKTLCLPAGLLVFGVLDLSATNGGSVDSSSELNLVLSGVFSAGSTAMCSTTTLCESGVCQRGLLWKVETPLEPFATGLPVPGHLGLAVGRPTPSKGHWVFEVLKKLPHLAHGSHTCNS